MVLYSYMYPYHFACLFSSVAHMRSLIIHDILVNTIMYYMLQE